MSDILDTPVSFLKGIGPEKAELLKKELNIFTFYDLLYHFPFRYVDRTSILPIGELDANLPYIQVVGRIHNVEIIGEGRAKRMVAIMKDETGSMELTWFKGLNFLKKIVIPGTEFLAFGKPTSFMNKINIVHPELEYPNQEMAIGNKIKLQPVYSTTEKLKTRGLDSKGIVRLQKILFEKVEPFLFENLPQDIRERFKLMGRKEAMFNIHFPETPEKQQHAQRRLKFEELFFIQVKLLQQKNFRKKEFQGHVFEKVGQYLNDFYNHHLPFELTNAQKRVIKEIRQDVRTGKQMNRLVQGDVGSGKTVVALMSMLLAIDNGMQACMMAPTEILAAQHYQGISKLTAKLGIRVEMLTGSSKTSERKAIAAALTAGEIHILIGTHALLEKWVEFTNLGMVVIDEQHRFGVAQRATLWSKNKIPPHILVMTATPIPRTLAMTLYGDLDNSVIDEMPPGRKEIVTKHFFEKERLKLFGFLKHEIASGRQVYVVYPLIEESETMDYKNLMEGYLAIEREFPKPDYQISIVNGRMSAADKEYEMQRFKNGHTHIMVSTTVIEVGVDVPNATVMVIESAERFGLAQMHQLRGRVGRGGNQSYCILMTEYKLSKEARVRLETMVRTNNGFEIAETDLKLRGPGDLAGTRQSGLLDLKIANLSTDRNILQAARDAAIELLDRDPNLALPENRMLSEYFKAREKNKPNWSVIS